MGEVLKALHIYDVFRPPVLAACLAMLLGMVPQLDFLFFHRDGALRFLTDALAVLGQAMIPCILLVLGANLVKGPGASALPMRTTLAVVVTRLVVVPLLGIAIVLCADRLGLLPPGDKMFRFVLLLQHAMPSSIQIGEKVCTKVCQGVCAHKQLCADRLGLLPPGDKMFRFVLLLQHAMPSSIQIGGRGWVQEDGCKRMGARGWVQEDGCKRMGARGWVQEDGCKRMGARGWVQEDGCERMGARGWVQEDGCERMGARGWVREDGCKRMGARGWVQEDGCERMGARGWVREDGCERMGARGWVQEDGCERMGARGWVQEDGCERMGVPGLRGFGEQEVSAVLFFQHISAVFTMAVYLFVFFYLLYG
ncbi:unnamed protein product [Closterium sp. Naga37s-1]|nr:unnamed protein product [Closterium sp. Naga37s-1]